jgi:hypothetical protein
MSIFASGGMSNKLREVGISATFRSPSLAISFADKQLYSELMAKAKGAVLERASKQPGDIFYVSLQRHANR